MQWVTREHARVDRIACPWLISRFIDREPRFLFVPPADVGRGRARGGFRSTCPAPSWATTAIGARSMLFSTGTP
jgi:chromate resistance exported protein